MTIRDARLPCTLDSPEGCARTQTRPCGTLRTLLCAVITWAQSCASRPQSAGARKAAHIVTLPSQPQQLSGRAPALLPTRGARRRDPVRGFCCYELVILVRLQHLRCCRRCRHTPLGHRSARPELRSSSKGAGLISPNLPATPVILVRLKRTHMPLTPMTGMPSPGSRKSRKANCHKVTSLSHTLLSSEFCPSRACN